MTFEEFWNRYYEDVVADLVRFGRLPEDAEELASDALQATWQKIDTIRPEARWVYLRMTARRRAMNHHRHAHTHARDESLRSPFDDLREKSNRSTPEDLAIAREIIAEVHAGIRSVMDELPEETRLYIVLRHRNYGYEQIARLLGVRLPAVQSRLYRATKRFEERLGPPPQGLTWIELAGEMTDDHKD